ncbi:hypothetical protein GCM10009504_40510 [Pseudomonas laurentiana]|uniref:Uncharacterized protein n=1 Tax=Pseudomonas laurentiana TaxID=2364649 RepID=A0A6I5RN06_9PSED|nr:hypothetical protein [Pseudomonas laurentiana]NES08946.1 hypothetical protein [Pseudomonas laurentiana]GGU79506.1 hypothetical protein GCM10009504_40510 [Pseudomonas laurentiana]
MSKPDWKDAPQWAEWLARDSFGEWYWFQAFPDCRQVLWLADYDTEHTLAGKSASGVDWKDSLEKRP